MKQVEKLKGYITVTFDFEDTFSVGWESDDLLKWFKARFKDYIDEDKAEFIDFEITDGQIEEVYEDE